METQVRKKRKKGIVVGLAGKAGSGKDTVFSLLQALVPHKECVRLAFGDEVKKEVADNHQIPVSLVDEQKDLFRGILQKWGTEYRRRQDEKYWINKVRTQVSFLRATADVIVVTDVRFLNEVDFIRDECRGYIVKVEGEEGRLLVSNHRSELELDHIKPDWLLPNRGDLQELAEGLCFLIQELGLEGGLDGE